MRPELVPQLKLISTTLSVTMKQTALNFVLIHLMNETIYFDGYKMRQKFTEDNFDFQ